MGRAGDLLKRHHHVARTRMNRPTLVSLPVVWSGVESLQTEAISSRLGTPQSISRPICGELRQKTMESIAAFGENSPRILFVLRPDARR